MSSSRNWILSKIVHILLQCSWKTSKCHYDLLALKLEFVSKSILATKYGVSLTSRNFRSKICLNQMYLFLSCLCLLRNSCPCNSRNRKAFSFCYLCWILISTLDVSHLQWKIGSGTIILTFVDFIRFLIIQIKSFKVSNNHI